MISIDLKNKSSSINVNKYVKKSFSFVFVMVIFLVINIFIVNSTIVSASPTYCSYGGFENNYYGYSNYGFESYNFRYNNYQDCAYFPKHNLKIIDTSDLGYCGDGICNYTNNTENALTCPEDCYV